MAKNVGLSLGHAREGQQQSKGQSLMRAGPTATLSTKRRGVQPTTTPCGVVASKLPSEAETKHCRSGTRAVYKQLMPK